MNFALIGAAGYVAPRHLRAIHETGHRLVAAMDPHDNVGILDRYAPDCRFFTEIERFDRFMALRARGPEADRVHMVAICSPNYLHDAHIRLALRNGADALCEKPVVINPWNLDALEQLEAETGRRVWTMLQLRVHPVLTLLRRNVEALTAPCHVELTYVTPRGCWYDVSWKGSAERSGGVAMNIGVHLFDLLIWLFGAVERYEVQQTTPRRLTGSLRLTRARVNWLLSTEANVSRQPFRELTVDDQTIDFTSGFDDLHTQVYIETLAGRGFGLREARPAIELTYGLRHANAATALVTE